MSNEIVNRLNRLIEAIVLAIPREESAYSFYTELSAESQDSASKEMFLFLARQEAAHKEKLEVILKRFQDELEAELKKSLKR